AAVDRAPASRDARGAGAVRTSTLSHGDWPLTLRDCCRRRRCAPEHDAEDRPSSRRDYWSRCSGARGSWGDGGYWSRGSHRLPSCWKRRPVCHRCPPPGSWSPSAPLPAPAERGHRLRTLEPERAAAVSRAVQVVNAVPPAGGRLTPAAANAARNITPLLDRAATVTQAGDQANLVRRAVGIADDFLGPGRRVAVIDALRDLATTQRGLADAYRGRLGVQRG